jgi:hypothetical protein
MRRLAIALPLVLLTSCTDDFEQFGVALIDGEPAVVSAPCEDQDVDSIELILTQEDVSPDESPVLWRAVTAQPRATAFITAFGDAPEGFETTIPLNAALAQGREYTIYMKWYAGEAGAVIVSRPRDLEAGRIMSQIGLLSPEGFLDYAREGCGGDLAEGAEAVVHMLE